MRGVTNKFIKLLHHQCLCLWADLLHNFLADLILEEFLKPVPTSASTSQNYTRAYIPPVQIGAPAQAPAAYYALLDGQWLQLRYLVRNQVDGTTAGIAHDKVVTQPQDIGLDSTEGVDSSGLGLGNTRDGGHAGLAGAFEGCVSSAVGPHRGDRQDVFDGGVFDEL